MMTYYYDDDYKGVLSRLLLEPGCRDLLPFSPKSSDEGSHYPKYFVPLLTHLPAADVNSHLLNLIPSSDQGYVT